MRRSRRTQGGRLLNARPRRSPSPWQLVLELARVSRSVAGTLRESRIPRELSPPGGRRVAGDTTSWAVQLDPDPRLERIAALARADEDGPRYLLVWLAQEDDQLRCLVGNFFLGNVEGTWSEALLAELATAKKGGWHLWADASLKYDANSPEHSTLAVWLP